MTRRILGCQGLLLTLCVGCQTPNAGGLTGPSRPTPTPPFTAAASPYSPILPRSPAPDPQSPPQQSAILPVKATPDDHRFEKFVHPPDLAVVPKQEAIVVKEPLPGPVVQMPKKQPIVLALERQLDNRPDEALRHLQERDAPTQEFLMRLLSMLSLVDGQNLRPETNAAIFEQLNALRKSLEQNSNFAITRLAFCDSIRGFAIYNPLPSSHEFLAAQPDRPGELVQLYVELKNFASEPMGGEFETRLASQIEIRDARGQVRWSHRFRPDDLKLVSRTRLSEYYHNYTFALPALPAGVYELHVETIDETHPAPRAARASQTLRVKN